MLPPKNMPATQASEARGMENALSTVLRDRAAASTFLGARVWVHRPTRWPLNGSTLHISISIFSSPPIRLPSLSPADFAFNDGGELIMLDVEREGSLMIPEVIL